MSIIAFIADASPRFAAWRAARRYRALQEQADQAACLPAGRFTAANDAPAPRAALPRQGGTPCA